MKYRNKILFKKIIVFAVLLFIAILFLHEDKIIFMGNTDYEISNSNQPIIDKLNIKDKHALVGGLLEEVMQQEIDDFFSVSLVGTTEYEFSDAVDCSEFDVYLVQLVDDATDYYMVPVGADGEHLRYIYLYHYFNNSLELIWTDQTE